MEKKIIVCVLFLSMILIGLASAQSQTPRSHVFKPSSLVNKPSGFLDSLLDPSKFSMSHSYSLSFFNVGKQTFNQGLYLNTMNYKFSDPLRMQVRIGFLHQPLGDMGMSQTTGSRVFVQRALLQYKPSDKMSISIDYQVIPSSLYYSPYYYYLR